MEYWKGMEIPDEAKVKAKYPDGTTKEFTTMLDAASECGVGVCSHLQLHSNWRQD